MQYCGVGEFIMKKHLLLAAIPFVLSACMPHPQPTVERQKIKADCVMGLMSACAEIGHIAREEQDAEMAAMTTPK
jgi:hypothetical protein